MASMSPVNKDWKCCGTCMMWFGPREPMHGGKFVKIPKGDIKGKCSRWNNQMQCSGKCPHFKHILIGK
jgi:hypothetical protein